MKIATGHITLAWYVCYEFVRQTGRGFVLTFGPLRANTASTQPYLGSQKYENVFENAVSEFVVQRREVA